MAKYIDADALLKSIDGNPYVTDSIKVYIRCCVRKAPAADVAPVVQGRWREDTDPVDGDIRCTNCGIAWPKCFRDEIAKQGIWTLQTLFRYCPNCGAKMDGMDGEKE